MAEKMYDGAQSPDIPCSTDVWVFGGHPSQFTSFVVATHIRGCVSKVAEDDSGKGILGVWEGVEEDVVGCDVLMDHGAVATVWETFC